MVPSAQRLEPFGKGHQLSSGCVSYERRLQSCEGFALARVNPSVCADSPQHWCQQQTESGDTEDQQVHLSRETRRTEMERAARCSYTFVSKHLHKAFKIFTL